MIAVLSHLISNEFEKATKIKSYPLNSYKKLDNPVSSHADMLLCVIDGEVFCYYDYYSQNISLFEAIKSLGYNVRFVSNECGNKYPNDISLNVLIIGKKLFCNEKNTAVEIKKYAKEKGYDIINVRQGYSACSTLVLNEKTAVTADIGMRNALEKEGIEVLFISSNDGIKLEGYNCGFIGGCGVVVDDKIYFFGSIKQLFDFDNIKLFAEKNQLSIFEIIPEDVCDFGGVKLFFHRK